MSINKTKKARKILMTHSGGAVVENIHMSQVCNIKDFYADIEGLIRTPFHSATLHAFYSTQATIALNC